VVFIIALAALRSYNMTISRGPTIASMGAGCEAHVASMDQIRSPKLIECTGADEPTRKSQQFAMPSQPAETTKINNQNQFEIFFFF